MPYEKKVSASESSAYKLFAQAGIPIPKVLAYDDAAHILTLEDLRETHISGGDAWAQAGNMVDMTADLHAAFWDNYEAFGEVGLPWRLDNPKNFSQHCKAMEKGIRPYCKAHKMDESIFRQALSFFRSKVLQLMETRFHAGKNITVVHGDLHPGNILLPNEEGTAVFVDLEAVRMGVGTEDLAMLFALHIAPGVEQALPILKQYHCRLCERVQDYTFETLLEDYRVALAEALFFPQKLFFHSGIDDLTMMENAITAWNGFCG